MPEQPSGQHLEWILSALKPLIEGVLASIKDDPTLLPEFRCPKDGSSRTFKVSAVLAARPRGTASSEGKTIAYWGGSQAVDALDPGPEPRNKNAFFIFGLIVVLVGIAMTLFGQGPSGCGGTAIMLVGAVAIVSSWYSDRDLEARHAKWERKMVEAKTHWWCEACHCVFLPEPKPEADPEGVSQAMAQAEEMPEAAEKVMPLRRPD